MQENLSDFPVYTDVEAVFKQRKTTDEKIQMMASCTVNGKTGRSVWIEVPTVLYNGYKGKVRIIEFNIKSGMLEVLKVQKV
ncbi:MAG: hypothetical protein Q8918_14620 [Bacteroidota bacterium]|nr:hypothetical protein [Bacteroidota bacterium]MDP4213918.1 hypothetical protein [Bacteroidota bacterium]MDP4251335.1 hypothetical protein [Bacteroidota bacterium]